jgi:hypothetical protein
VSRVRRPALFAVVLALVAACGPPSEVDRGARIEVFGSATHHTGAPVTGTTVMLTKDVGPAEFLSGGLTVMFWGFPCLQDPDLEPCGRFAHYAETDSDGRFTFALRGGDVQSGFGTASRMLLTVAGPGADGLPGPTTTHELRINAERVDLAPLRLWHTDLRIAEADGTVTVDWDDPPAHGRSERHVVQFLDGDGVPVWQARRGEGVDLRVLEDQGRLVTAEVVEVEGPTTAIYRSGARAVRGPGAPPSRGAACRALAEGREALRLDTCPLTDGDLAGWADLPDPPCPGGQDGCPPPQTAIVVELPEPLAPSLVVLRGDDDPVLLRVSPDGLVWSPPVGASIRGGTAVVRLPAGEPVRFVRLDGDDTDLPDLVEVSVW